MANDKSIFKYLVCSCGYKKTDTTGKAKADCKNCGNPMYLSESWYARITNNGRTTTKAISPRKRDAEDYIAACKVAKRAGTLLPGQEKDKSWADAVKDAKKWWADAVTTKEIKQSTADFYGFNLVALDRFFEGKSLLTISKSDLMEYQVSRIRDDIQPSTINHERTTILRVYALHLDRTTPDDSPKLFARHLDLSRVKKLEESREKPRFLTADEANELLKHCTPIVRLAVLIGLNTGLRKQNVLDLEWMKHVNLKQRLIKLPGSAMKNGEPHTVDIPEHLAKELKTWRDGQQLSSFVFPTLAGDDPEKTIRNDLEKAVAAAGLSDVTFHTTRHTFASQWLMSGGDLSTLSEILGHSDISITKNIYGHLSREHKRKAHDAFAAGFLSQIS